MADGGTKQTPVSDDLYGEPEYEPFEFALHPFLKWFMIAMAIQFAAWLLMFIAHPFRPIYYAIYFPFFFIFPGPHYPRYGLAFFIFYLPVAGSITYSVVAGLIATRFRNRRRAKPVKEASAG